MRIAFGADDKTHLTDTLIAELERRGHRVSAYGPPAGEQTGWADVAREVGELVALGAAEQAVLCCWTGTGVAMMANKVPGVRAALCHDAETARGARLWNDANTLCLSLRSTSETVAKEILDAWFSVAAPDPSEAANIRRVQQQDVARGPL
jgi:ribose 5-phosphate isomerase B